MRNLSLFVAILLLMGAFVQSSCAAVITWTSIGPGGGGWIESIATDPFDPALLHLGCDVGGYYRSADFGGHWRIQNAGLQDYFVQCIAVSPVDRGLILLGCEGGIHKSTDGGKTWLPRRDGFPALERYAFSAPIGALTFDPAHSRVVYAGIGRPRWGNGGAGAIYRSDDAGETWRLCPRGDIPADAIVGGLLVAPDGSFALAATDKGLFRSEDGGRTWLESDAGLTHKHCGRVAISRSAPEVCYLTIDTLARDQEPFDGGVYKSVDRGRTWVRKSSGLADRVGPKGGPYQLCSGYREIVISPTDPNTVYVGSTAWVSSGLYKSEDGGERWSATGPVSDQPGIDYGWICQWGATVECLAISTQRPDTLVIGTSGHAFVTRDGAKTWHQAYCTEYKDGRFAGNGLEVTCLNSITFDPRRKERVYCGYFDIGLLISDDLGKTFRRSAQGMKNAGNTFTVLADPAVPGKLWAGTGEWGANVGDVCRSVDDGRTWTVVGKPETGLPNGQTRTLLLDPASPPSARRLYVTVNGHGVYMSEDGGTSWRAANEGLPEKARGGIAGLVMSPGTAGGKPVLRCLLSGKTEDGSGIYESPDGGASWRKVSTQGIFGDCKQLVADPKSFDTLYVCLRETQSTPGGLWRSADGGRTFVQLYDYHFAQCMAVNPRSSSILYLGLTDHPYHDGNVTPGLLVSRDGGKTWQPENTGLTSSHISSITVDPHDPGLIVVGTGGNGMFVGRDDR